MVHVPKNDGQTRSCGDYSVTLNPCLKVPQYPVPLPEDVFSQTEWWKVIHQAGSNQCIPTNALRSRKPGVCNNQYHRGLYQYKRLPFDIASSPAIFQRTMEIILQGLEYVALIQDDILISGLDDSYHLSNLEKVLGRLDSYGLRLKLGKCKFMQPSVIYMGMKLSAEEISPTEEKVNAIKDAPTPENHDSAPSLSGYGELSQEIHSQFQHHFTPIESTPSKESSLEMDIQLPTGFRYSQECPFIFKDPGTF